MYFKEQPRTRIKQIEVLKSMLSAKFDKLELYNSEDLSGDYDYQSQVFIANNITKFIRIEDNSIRGFKHRCKSPFI